MEMGLLYETYVDIVVFKPDTQFKQLCRNRFSVLLHDVQSLLASCIHLPRYLVHNLVYSQSF